MSLKESVEDAVATGMAQEGAASSIIQFPLFRLAPEVRDLIFEIVLTTTILSDSRNPTDRTHRKQLNSIHHDILEDTTWYSTEPVPSPAKGLLLTCRQVRHEVLGLIKRVKKASSRYELSITILEEQYIYPTWLLVPSMPSKVASLVWTDIHIAGSSVRTWHTCGWRPGNGWPPRLIWGLFSMLNRFLVYGPAFADWGNDKTELIHTATNPRPQSREIQRLKVLVLNVITPTEVEMEGKEFFPITHSLRGVPKTEGVTHPEALLDCLNEHVSYIARREKHTAQYSRLLYKRVKMIRLCVDGKERGSYDLNEEKKQVQ